MLLNHRFQQHFITLDINSVFSVGISITAPISITLSIFQNTLPLHVQCSLSRCCLFLLDQQVHVVAQCLAVDCWSVFFVSSCFTTLRSGILSSPTLRQWHGGHRLPASMKVLNILPIAHGGHEGWHQRRSGMHDPGGHPSNVHGIRRLCVRGVCVSRFGWLTREAAYGGVVTVSSLWITRWATSCSCCTTVGARAIICLAAKLADICSSHSSDCAERQKSKAVWLLVVHDTMLQMSDHRAASLPALENLNRHGNQGHETIVTT